MPIGKPSRDELAAAANRTIPDVVGPDLRVLFSGINPSLYSAATGHHFARPGNRSRWGTARRIRGSMQMIEERDRSQAQAHTRRARVVTLELAPASLVADAIVRRLTSVTLVLGPASHRP